MNDENPLQKIDFERFLKCPKCQDEEPYCKEHRIEVEMLLSS